MFFLYIIENLKKLHFYITETESNAMFLFCERDQTYLMCLQELAHYNTEDLVISFTEQLQKTIKNRKNIYNKSI